MHSTDLPYAQKTEENNIKSVVVLAVLMYT